MTQSCPVFSSLYQGLCYMRMSQETTRVEDQEGSRRGREYESSWLGLTAEE